MRTLAVILALATPAIAGDCHTSFCRQKVVAVKAVHHAHFAYPAVYAVPYGAQSYGSFADQADILTAAIKQGVGEVLDERGIGNLRANVQGGIDLGKCTRCHGETSKNANAREAFQLSNDATLDAPTAAKVLKGLRAGMAGPQYANLDDKSQQVWFDALVETLGNHFTQGE